MSGFTIALGDEVTHMPHPHQRIYCTMVLPRLMTNSRGPSHFFTSVISYVWTCFKTTENPETSLVSLHERRFLYGESSGTASLMVNWFITGADCSRWRACKDDPNVSPSVPAKMALDDLAGARMLFGTNCMAIHAGHCIY